MCVDVEPRYATKTLSHEAAQNETYEIIEYAEHLSMLGVGKGGLPPRLVLGLLKLA